MDKKDTDPKDWYRNLTPILEQGGSYYRVRVADLVGPWRLDPHDCEADAFEADAFEADAFDLIALDPHA